MCPICLATTVGWIVAGSVSTGGLAALAVKLSRKSKSAAETDANPSERSIYDVSEDN
jgi:hypothetical protein